MNGQEFLEFLHGFYVEHENGQLIPQNHGQAQYFFKRWYQNQFQFFAVSQITGITRTKSIRPDILIGVKNAWNFNNNLPIKEWCIQHNFDRGDCPITVMKNLLSAHP